MPKSMLSLPRALTRTLFAGFFLVAAVVVPACGGDEGKLHRVQLTASGWFPKRQLVEPGDSVVFEIKDPFRAQVVSTAPTGLFDSGADDPLHMGQAFEWKVPKDIMYDEIRYEDAISRADGTLEIVRN